MRRFELRVTVKSELRRGARLHRWPGAVDGNFVSAFKLLLAPCISLIREKNQLLHGFFYVPEILVGCGYCVCYETSFGDGSFWILF